VFLYELAIDLDVRSTELVDAAAEMGMGELQPAAELDAQQVSALRARFGRPVAPPLPPPAAAAAPPAPTGGRLRRKREPAAAPAPPAPAAPGAAPGPAVWGAQGPTPLAPAPAAGLGVPATWGAPTPTPAPPPPAPPSQLGSPVSWGAPSPVPPSSVPGEGPAAAPSPAPPVAASPVAPAHWGPPVPAPTASTGPGPVGPAFSYPEGSAPPAGGPGLGAPAPMAYGAPGVPPMPTPGPVASGGTSTGQKVLIGGVIAAVLALFAFMAVNTGPDEERQDAIEASDAAAEREAGNVDPASSADVDGPVDVAEFCRGGRGIMPIELRIAAAITDDDFPELQAVIRERREAWSEAVDAMAAGASPAVADDVEAYRSGYLTYFEAIESSSSLLDLQRNLDRDAIAGSTRAGQAINAEIAAECQ